MSVNRLVRHNLLRTVLLGLGESGDPFDDRQRRAKAVEAAMDLLAYVEGLEADVEQAQIRLMYSAATAASPGRNAPGRCTDSQESAMP